MPSVIDGLFKTPFSGKDGKISWPWLKFFQETLLKGTAVTVRGTIALPTKVDQRTEPLSTTIQHISNIGTVQAAGVGFTVGNVPDDANYAKVSTAALTKNQVDLPKSGVIGFLPSSKAAVNVMANYSNNATVDSIDNGTNATIRVYGPGGPGTTWHQFIGSGTGPEIPAFSGTAAYNTDFNVYLDAAGIYHITTNGSDTLPDGIQFSGSLHTVSMGGGGGSGGGGGTGGGGGGGAGARK